MENTSYSPDGIDHHILILQTSTANITGPQPGSCTLYRDVLRHLRAGYVRCLVADLELGRRPELQPGQQDEIADSVDDLDNGAQDSRHPIVPLLLRFSEVPLGARRPLRIAFPSPTNWFVWPGTGCCAGSGPPQGLLYRLKASVNWQPTCPGSTNPQAATVLQAMQQYGAYMSDHGAAGYVGGVSDIQWDDDDLACIKRFTMADLEVVDNSMLAVSSISGQTVPTSRPQPSRCSPWARLTALPCGSPAEILQPAGCP